MDNIKLDFREVGCLEEYFDLKEIIDMGVERIS
jgi:hypothetical protein